MVLSHPTPLENATSLLLAVVMGIGVLVILVAPLLAWVFHKHNHEPLTRRSMALTTLAFACFGTGPLCIGLALSVNDFWLRLVLLLAGVLCMPAFVFPLLLAFSGRQHTDPARHAGTDNGPPEDGEDEAEHSS